MCHQMIPSTSTSFAPAQDSPQQNAAGQTISAPHMHAICLELLKDHLAPGSRVLDVGETIAVCENCSGSGYLTAAMAIMVGESGRITGIDKVRDLVVASVLSIENACPQLSGKPAQKQTLLAGAELLGCGINWDIYAGNVLSDILNGVEQFSAIHVGAAANLLHEKLLAALAPGGRMVVPLGEDGGEQHLCVVDKDVHGNLQQRTVMEVRYVPLTSPESHAD
eukprot:363869-Chlamydomonas_euryale.AAC.23